MLSRLLANRGGWWLLVGVLALGAAAAAGLASGGELAGGIAGGCAALAVLALGWALRLWESARASAAREAQAARLANARADEVRHLAAVRMPEISRRVRGGRRLDGVPGQLTPPAVVGEDFSQALAVLADALGSDEAVRRERALRDSVQAAFESVARNMHAMATVQMQVLDSVEKIISDPRLMSEVMRADHAAAQMTRKAQTLLVMCGIWPARRESRPVSLYDCVRGAQSRIVEFGRVEVHGGQTLYAVPPAVEGMMHSIAELLENATVFSPSSTQVVVTVREVGAGAVIEIDDAGLGMPPDTLHQAVGQLRDDVDLATLGAVPRLGLACVGRWARELGLNVELTGASAYGGTRAVVFVPHRLLTEPTVQEPRRDDVHPPHPRYEAPQAPSHTSPQTPPVPTPTPYGGRDAAPDTSPGAQAPPAQPDQGSGGSYLPVRQRASSAAPLPPVSRSDGPPRDGGQQEPAESEATTSGLPKRRSRRREPGAGAPVAPGTPSRPTSTFDAFGPPQAPPPQDPPKSEWTPEAARASVASVLSGTRRGRAELAEPRGGELAVPDGPGGGHGRQPQPYAQPAHRPNDPADPHARRPPAPSNPHPPLPDHSPHPYGDQP